MKYILKFLQWLKNRLFKPALKGKPLKTKPFLIQNIRKDEPQTVGKNFKFTKPVNKRFKRSIFAKDLRTLKTLY